MSDCIDNPRCNMISAYLTPKYENAKKDIQTINKIEFKAQNIDVMLL